MLPHLGTQVSQIADSALALGGAAPSVAATRESPTSTPTSAPTRERIRVSDAVLARLARVSSGLLTTKLYKKSFRQPVMVGLHLAPLQGTKAQRFVGRAYTLRMIWCITSRRACRRFRGAAPT